jgi:hypothetical protein
MTGDGVLRPAFIRKFTAEVAAIVAAEHARDPRGELLVWLQMALRREASVGQIYGVSNLDRRLDQVRGPQEIISLLRRTITNIWTQEKSHAAYLEAALIAVARPSTLWRRLSARLEAFLGAMEGQLLAGRTSPSDLQRAKAALMLAIGRQVQDVPDFVYSLSALSFREYCLLNAELEITAVHGYERILTLAREIAKDSSTNDSTLVVDFARMLRDERFHNRAFIAMEEWFGPSPSAPHAALRGGSVAARPEASSGDSLRPGVSLDACASRLAAIRSHVYGLELGQEENPG